MTEQTDRKTHEPDRAPGPGTWLMLICAVLLCPLSKIVTLAAVGGVFGGLFGMPWLIAIAVAAIAGSGWVVLRTLRHRGTRCQPAAKPEEPEHR